ncbi:MAG TPA: hypothetical protein VJM33_03065 [Microthrixaceae bacterium]|nr:hypothetical protein [Microthrixaceae bacterium]
MARLEVVAVAGAGFATDDSTEAAQVDVSVCATDGTPVTGLTEAEIEVWVTFSGNISGGGRAWVLVVEKVNGGLGRDGFYNIAFRNGEGGEGELAQWGRSGTYFVEVIVTVGPDSGRDVTAFDLP